MMIATRLVCSMSWASVMLVIICCAMIGPFVHALLSESRRDAKKAAILALTIIAIVVTLIASAEAADRPAQKPAEPTTTSVPVRDQCATCQDSGAPAWVCWFYCL